MAMEMHDAGNSAATEERLRRHDAFWKREPQDRPLLTFTTGDRFPYDKMNASRDLLQPGLRITPDMVDVDAFAEQTAEELEFRRGLGIPSDMFLCVAPFGGIPWMECLLGCGVRAMGHSFVSEPCQTTPGDPAKLDARGSKNAWLDKFDEFLRKYEARFGDETPVTECLMRGCLDVYGAIIGQEAMVYAFYDEPETAAAMLDAINRFYVAMVGRVLAHSRRFHGGMLHPYGIWAPGTVNQFQEDLSSIVTPAQMERFVAPLHNRMCARFQYNGMHTHPTSYHVFPQLLGVRGLQLVQAQKDEGDPPIHDKLGVLRSVQAAGKCLFFTGDLSFDEADALLDALEPRGLALSLMVKDVDEALVMHDHVLEYCSKKRAQNM